jgi:hypothetical protein
VTAGADGRIGVEKKMVVNLTADHRIVYGAHAAGGQRAPPECSAGQLAGWCRAAGDAGAAA